MILRRRFAGPFALTLALSLAAGARSQPLEFDECRLERAGLPAAFAECAVLAVPESPAEADSAPLELFVARVRATTATPAPDPLVLINGGPGGSTVDLYLQTRSAFAQVLREREIILLDQRGTGRSLAGLECDTPAGLELETATASELREAVGNCIAAFPRDPGLFTTSVAVADLEVLRARLGADRWNVYGISYGTRVAQHYLRRYPERVRSIILDGVVPADLVLGPAIAADAQAALDRLFARCAGTRPCAERFGDLGGKFAALKARFENDSIEIRIEDPRTGEPQLFELGEIHLQAVVRLMSYADTTAALLPLVIDAAYAGNYQPLAAQADFLIESIAESIGFAMHNSVVCTEDVPFFPAASGADAAGSVVTGPYLGTTIVESLQTICEIWPVGLRDPDFAEPVVSHAPALLLSGENDPVTPPAYADRVIAGGLDNAMHLIGRGKGHGLAAVGCVPDLISEFLRDPRPAALDAGCLELEGPMPFFLNFQGPGP